MESFFSLLQKNVLNRRRWATREDLRSAIVTWIERTYHRRRRQDRLGRLTPIEYGNHHDHSGRTRRLRPTVTDSCSRPVGLGVTGAAHTSMIAHKRSGIPPDGRPADVRSWRGRYAELT